MAAAVPPSGLDRLQRALTGPVVAHTWKNNQRASTVAKTVEFCRRWTPTDTYTSFAARHPELDAERWHAKLLRIRAKIPGIPARVFLAPWQIAQAYLASLPEHLRGAARAVE